MSEIFQIKNPVILIGKIIEYTVFMYSLSLLVNSLHGLPTELEYLCDTLEELTIEGNLHLKALPDEYENLTTLKRLSLDVELLGSFNIELLSWATTLESLEFDGGKK